MSCVGRIGSTVCLKYGLSCIQYSPSMGLVPKKVSMAITTESNRLNHVESRYHPPKFGHIENFPSHQIHQIQPSINLFQSFLQFAGKRTTNLAKILVLRANLRIWSGRRTVFNVNQGMWLARISCWQSQYIVYPTRSAGN